MVTDADINAFLGQPAQSWDELQATIKNLPETERVKRVQAWADAQETEANKQGSFMGTSGAIGDTLRTVDNAVRTVARGVPGGTYLDELNAYTYSKLPTWMGGKSYEEQKALEDARDRRIVRDNPKSAFAGNVAGTAASIPFTPARLLGVGGAMVLGGLQGSGEGNTPGERAFNAGLGAATGGVAQKILGGSVGSYDRYTRTTPEVQRAATELGTPQPFFVRAESPQVQAAGRQFAQQDAATNARYAAGQEAVTNAAENVVQREVGAPPATAPYAAGTQARAGMENTIEDINARVATLANESRNAVPPGFKTQPVETGKIVDTLRRDRVDQGKLNPDAGLGDIQSFAGAPRPYEAIQRTASEVGEAAAAPNIGIPRDVSGAESARILPRIREDQAVHVRQGAEQLNPGSGAAAEARFRANLPAQEELLGMRGELANLIKDPEQLVNAIYNWSTVKGAGTNLDKLGIVLGNLAPADARQLAVGVFAHMQNKANGSLGALANQLAAIPAPIRQQLFGPGTRLAQEVENILTLAARHGEVDSVRHVGSAATIAGPMTKAYGAAQAIANPLVSIPLGVGGALLGIPGAATAAIAAPAIWGASKAGEATINAVRRYLLQHGLPGPAMSPNFKSLADMLANATARNANEQMPWGGP